MHALWLSRMPAVRTSDRRGKRRHQSLSAGRRFHHCRARATDVPTGASARSRMRRRGAVGRRPHHRERVHRLHAVHRRVPCRRDHWRAEAHACGTAIALHRMRIVRATLPRGLHRARARPGPRLDRERCRRGAAPLPPSERANRAARAHRPAPACGTHAVIRERRRHRIACCRRPRTGASPPGCRFVTRNILASQAGTPYSADHDVAER